MTYILDLHNAGRGVLHNDVVEFAWVGEAANHAHGDLICLLGVRRRLPNGNQQEFPHLF